MHEMYMAIKSSTFFATVGGVLISLNFVKMTNRQKIVAFPISLFLSEALGEPVAAWLGITTPFAIGAAFGLFGMGLLKLIFDSLQKSSIAFDLQGLVNAITSLFRRQ